MPAKRQLRGRKSTVGGESEDSGEGILVKLEELIGSAFGSRDDNSVDFKMVQAICHILAKHMHILRQNVEVRLYDHNVHDRLPDQSKQFEIPEIDQGKKQQTVKKSSIKRTDVKADVEELDVEEGKREEKRESKTVHMDVSVDQKARQVVQQASKSGARSDASDDGRTRHEEPSSLPSKEQLEAVVKSNLSRQSIGKAESFEVLVAKAEDFKELKDFVHRLHNMLEPIPEPLMPDNEKLKEDIEKGTATLSDTMEALQINARIKAAEDALKYMTDLLKKLVKAGALPSEVLHDLDDMQSELKELGVDVGGPDGEVRLSITSQAAVSSKLSIGPSSKQNTNVKKHEIYTLLEHLRKEMLSQIDSATSKAMSSFAYTNHMVRTVMEKYDEITALDNRISGLDSLVADYTKQLKGCDSGNETQLKIFTDQMKTLREDTATGVKLADSINTNEDTMAVKDLKRTFGDLQKDMSSIADMNFNLQCEQENLQQNLTAITAAVEKLRELKADREEVEDAFRDKADMGRLQNLLKETAFSVDRRRALMHFDKFAEQIRKERIVWEGCIKDLLAIVNNKVDRQQLADVNQNEADKMKQIQAQVKQILRALSEPKAAMVTLTLPRTGSVLHQSSTPMALNDENKRKPLHQDAMPNQTERDKAEECCVAKNLGIDLSKHACKRLVGGSHTMMNDCVTRQQAPRMELHDLNSVRSEGFDADGHIYKMEQKADDLQQCIECNEILLGMADHESTPTESGGGDHGLGHQCTSEASVIEKLF